MYVRQQGDILMFRRLQTLEVREIDWIERLKDGRQPYIYYHCSVVVDENTQIESDGKMVITNTIPSGGFDAFRPPILPENRQRGVEQVKKLVGQKYDWVLIVDDALRALTHNLLHLPIKFVAREERYRKICSTIVVAYLNAAGWNHGLTQNALPEDIYIVLRNYQVSTA
ncbi:hypothetical protein NZD89_10885 [Alicyclobacillus fastidiosus]|uniref:Uncharacterized protein n=1 Tax=Alicyclobacillus fastidiosus TaxID=392011 RepID=A0ABY6ZP51_9BACL|nr:hypothetical protein [Alicyclobacillus fastidiosus]WAH43841.1 hypothetical protein NZD89_10885 [Alicyclobacillus fastidiosus]GMA60073.1 hypothetical protein GCM10025859_05130 [Alicyclobacillus fastidiosus]